MLSRQAPPPQKRVEVRRWHDRDRDILDIAAWQMHTLHHRYILHDLSLVTSGNGRRSSRRVYQLCSRGSCAGCQVAELEAWFGVGREVFGDQSRLPASCCEGAQGMDQRSPRREFLLDLLESAWEILITIILLMTYRLDEDRRRRQAQSQYPMQPFRLVSRAHVCHILVRADSELRSICSDVEIKIESNAWQGETVVRALWNASGLMMCTITFCASYQ